jgi:mono/diheme cytochrome c family protein
MSIHSAVRGLTLVLMFLGTAASSAANRAPQATKEAVPDGSYVFRTYCASCHGAAARGDGPLAEAMKRRPADLTGIQLRNRGAFPKDLVYRIIDGREKVRGHGGPDMPVWGDAFLRSADVGNEGAVRARIQALVDFLETIQVRNTP